MPAPFDLARIGEGLAFARHTEELITHLRTGACVVQAPPGSGKTTLAPPVLANQLAPGPAPKVLISAPRRIAVRAAAGRLSHLDGSELGHRVGYTIRGERARGRHTRVEFLTPGVLLRRLIADPELAGVGGVILDEVHERSLETDLLVGMLTDLRTLREDLHLVAMSATLAAERFAELLGGAPVLRSSGEQHPVSLSYAPFAGARFTDRGISRAFLDHVARTATRAAAEDPASDVLVFLPGRSEITQVAGELARGLPGVEVLALYSGAPPEVQRRVLSGRDEGGAQRVVVATDVAESSLTVPGVHAVVDSCLAREPRRDTRRGMSGLVTITASQAAGDQRAGRAGRLGPGRAYRCIDEAAFASAPPAPTPEVATASLTSAALLLGCWGAPGGIGMALPDPLPAEALAQAHEELRELGAIDDDGRPNALGRRLATMPVEPALGRALLQAGEELGARAAAQIIAVFAVDARPVEADLPGLLRALSAGTHPASPQWRAEAKRLQRLVPQRGSTTPRGAAPHLGYVAALGPGRIARRDSGSYLLASGTRASLPEGSPLAGEEWLVITDVARSTARAAAGTGAMIRAAAPITRAEVEAAHPPSTRRRVEVHEGRVRAREEVTFGAIVETSTPVASTAAENAEALTAHVRRRGLAILPWGKRATTLRGRLAALHAHLGDPWPAVDDDHLTDDLTWLAGYLTGPDLNDVPLVDALGSLVWDRAAELDRLAPTHFQVPSGRRVALTYPFPHDGTVRLAVKLQECFGLTSSPTVMGGTVPITFELLSPANRPLAVTRDLEFFWSEVYPQVRAENRARYAKHPWPEVPDHVATAATNRQLQRRRR